MELLSGWTVVDYILVGALLLAFVVGWAKGVIRLLTGFLSFLVSIFLAGRYSHLVVDWVNATWHVQQRLEDALLRRLNLPPAAAQAPDAPVPSETALSWLQGVPLPDVYKQRLAEQVAQRSAMSTGEPAAEFLVEQIAGGLLDAVAFVLSVVVLSALIGLLGRYIAEVVHAIPLVGTADRLLGGLTMGLEAALVLSFVVVWLVPTLSMYGARELGEAFAQARTAPYFVMLFELIRSLLFSGGTRLWTG